MEEALTEPLLGNSEDEVIAVKTKLAVVVTKFRTLQIKVQEIKTIAAAAKAQGTWCTLFVDSQGPVSRLLGMADRCFALPSRRTGRVSGDPCGAAGGDVRATVLQHCGQGGRARDRSGQYQGQGTRVEEASNM